MLACLPGGRMLPDVSKIHTNEIAPRRLRRELYAPVLTSKPSAHLQKPSLQDIASARARWVGGVGGGSGAAPPLHTEFGDQVDEVVGVERLGGVGDEARGDGALAHLLAGVGRERHSGDRGGA